MPSHPKKHEPTDWRFAIEQIGRELGKIYRQPKRLPRRLRAVVTELKRKIPVRRGPQRGNATKAGGNHLPRYHFVVRAPDHTTLDDPDGMHLPNHEAARDEAHRIVRELREDGYHPGDAVLLVHDETGQTVHSIPF